MWRMFEDSQFNGDISNWDVSNVTHVRHMFDYSQFNGDISKWSLPRSTRNEEMFGNGNTFNDEYLGSKIQDFLMPTQNARNINQASELLKGEHRGEYRLDITDYSPGIIDRIKNILFEPSKQEYLAQVLENHSPSGTLANKFDTIALYADPENRAEFINNIKIKNN